MPNKERFSSARLDALKTKWKRGGAAFLTSYRERCEIMYQIKQELAKPGCRGEFKPFVTKELDPPLSYRTALYMSDWHEIHVLHTKGDPDGPDARDAIDETAPRPITARENGKPRARAPRVTLVLMGELATAVALIKKTEKYKDEKTAITEAVLRYARQLGTPIVIATPSEEPAAKPKAAGVRHVA